MDGPVHLCGVRDVLGVAMTGRVPSELGSRAVGPQPPAASSPAGADPSRGPVRAHDLILRIGADTDDALAWELRHLADTILREGLSRWACSGSPSVGYQYSYRHDPAQTHDEYFRQIDEWLTRDRDGSPEGSETRSGSTEGNSPAPEGGSPDA